MVWGPTCELSQSRHGHVKLPGSLPETADPTMDLDPYASRSLDSRSMSTFNSQLNQAFNLSEPMPSRKTSMSVDDLLALQEEEEEDLEECDDNEDCTVPGRRRSSFMLGPMDPLPASLSIAIGQLAAVPIVRMRTDEQGVWWKDHPIPASNLWMERPTVFYVVRRIGCTPSLPHGPA